MCPSPFIHSNISGLGITQGAADSWPTQSSLFGISPPTLWLSESSVCTFTASVSHVDHQTPADSANQD